MSATNSKGKIVLVTSTAIVVMSLASIFVRSYGARFMSTTARKAAAGPAAATAATTQHLFTLNTVVEGKNEIEARLPADIEDLHVRAVEKGDDTYIDSRTGFTVFTRLAHLRRGECCGSYCRHCPYGHMNVKPKIKGQVAPASVKSAGAVAAEAAREAAKAAGSAPPKHSGVYTKGGDKGSSALFTGERRKKTDAVFEALGAVDELSSHIGVTRALLREMASKQGGEIALMADLEDIQQQLLNIGTVIATPAADETKVDAPLLNLLNTYSLADKTVAMEASIDAMDAKLTPLRIFILPGGGNTASAQLHVCRTTCRRAERRMVDVRDLYGEQYTDHLRQATVYVNRLSDFLFIAARSVAEEDIVRKYV